MAEKEKTCWTCGYKKNIPGDCHISCVRLFDDVQPPKAKIVQGGRWYHFPMNFDPVWQEEKCMGWAEKKDPKRTKVFSPLEEVFGMLGGR